jgi:hypothetical protein
MVQSRVCITHNSGKYTQCKQLVLVDYICKHLLCERQNQKIILSFVTSEFTAIVVCTHIVEI